MAFEEVAVNPDEMGGNFYQFKDLGQTLEGYYTSTGPSTSQYAKPGDLRVVVATKEGFKTVDPLPAHLKASIVKAQSEGKLKPGCKIKMKLASHKPIPGQEKPMGLFSVMIDPEVTPLALKLIASAPAAPAPTQQPPAQQPQPKPTVEKDPFDF